MTISTSQLLSYQFKELDLRRDNKLNRARNYSRLTIPSLLPKEGFTQKTNLPVPYSSAAARNIVRLAAKIVSSLFPFNNIPFFQLDPTQEAFISLTEDGFSDIDIQNLYSNLENRILDELYSSNLREALYTAMQHLIVIGDVVLFEDDNFNFQVYRLDNFVCRRDGAGNLVELIVREYADPEILPPELQKKNGGKPKDPQAGPLNNLEPIFTKIRKVNDKWEIKKEFRDELVSTAEVKVSPYMVLRWSAITNEDYGRSLVEENIGDIRSIEGYAKALLEGAAAASEFRIGVDPTGYTAIRDILTSSNGDIVPMREQDVWTLQLENFQQLATTQSAKNDLEAQLGQIFLTRSAAELRGERVTATQVRQIATELEEALGGVFALFARDIQLPIVKRSLAILFKKHGKTLPPEIEQSKIRITSGLDALGRELEGAAMVAFADIVLRLPEEAAKRIDWGDFMKQLLDTSGIRPRFIKSDEEMAEEDQQQTAAALQAQAAQQGIESAGALLENDPSLLG